MRAAFENPAAAGEIMKKAFPMLDAGVGRSGGRDRPVAGGKC